jgi:hypothetical protein
VSRLGAAVALLLVAVSCGGNSAAVRRAAADVEIVGATREQASLLRGVLAGIGETAIARIAVERPGPLWQPLSADAVELRVAPRADAERLRFTWEAALVAGAVRDLSAMRGLPPVTVYSDARDGVRIVGPDETATVLPRREAHAGLVEHEIREAALRLGVETVAVDVLEPYGLAPVVTLRSSDPARALSDGLDPIIEPYAGHGSGYDGAFLTLLDDRGEPVFTEWVTQRAAGASTWSIPELSGCFLRFSQPDENAPPPCAVGR